MFGGNGNHHGSPANGKSGSKHEGSKILQFIPIPDGSLIRQVNVLIFEERVASNFQAPRRPYQSIVTIVVTISNNRCSQQRNSSGFSFVLSSRWMVVTCDGCCRCGDVVSKDCAAESSRNSDRTTNQSSVTLITV